MNQSGNKVWYLFIIVILLAVMILGISSQASASKLVNKMSRDDTWPLDVAVDSNGYVYAAWNGPGGLVKMDSTGNVISVFNITNDFQCPFQIAVDANGYIYVIDSNANYYRFTILAADGSIFRQKDEFMYKLNNQLWDLTVDSSGNFYCVTYNSVAAYSPWINKYDSNFNRIVEFATYKGQNYPCPWGLATTGDYIYYTDDGLGRIVKVDSGLIETVVKSGVTHPKLLAVDGSGNIYYTDLNTGDIRKIDTNGNVWVYAQGLNPQGIAVDNDGHVYIANRHGSSGEIDLVIPSPSVSGVSPAGGPREGGTSVIISGSEFTGASAVMFGDKAATSFRVDSNNQITAVAPAGSSVVDVTVTTEGGASAISANSCFYYNPVVSGISPSSGPAAGGTTVLITGTGFSSNAVVKFGSATASFTLDSSTQITATAPAGSGVEHVTVTTPGGTSATSSADQFTFIPDVTGFSPNSGPLQGGTTVTITGHGFIGATAVKFGDTAATNFKVDSANQITAISPPGSGTVDITVITPGGVATSTTPRFNFLLTPAVSSLSLHEGTAQGYTSITITGTGFVNVTGVSFGNIKAKNYTVNSDTKITATTPMWAGTVHVYVTTEVGTSPATDNDLYTFTPAIQSFSVPDPPYGKSGPATGGTKVEIYGYGIGYVYDEATAQRILITPTAVYFGTTPATNVSSVWLYPGKITANAPPGCGVVDVTVETAYGTTATTANAIFKYIPIVNSITQTSGPAAGGTEVTINGAGFTSDSTVKFGATAAANVTYISDKQIKVISPPGSGKVDITVTTPGGTSATGAYDQFSFIPIVSGISPMGGPASGGISVIITGAGFTGATAVKFGATSATSYTIDSDTQITATAPAGFGKVDVTVTTAGGTSATSTNDQFGFIPVVTSISPVISQETGGISVTITGGGFTGATEVRFGTKAAISFTVNDNNSITATAPAGSGTVHITVITPGGVSLTGSSDQFVYDSQGPTVTIGSTVSSSTNISPIPVRITFSETVTGFDIGDIIVSNGTKSNFSSSGTIYTLDVTPSIQGTVTVSIAAGVAQDAAGNGNSAATSFTCTFDTQNPGVTISSTSNNSTNTAPIPVAITFSEAVTGFVMSDISVTNGTITNFSGNGATYIASITPDGQGLITVNIAAGVIKDAAGNDNTAAAQFSRTYDSIAPTGNLTINNEATATFDPAVTLTINVSDTGGSGITRMRFSNDNQNWSAWETFTVSKNWTLGNGINGNCTVYMAVQDAAGNSQILNDTIAVRVSAPELTPGGNYNTPYITMTCATLGAEIRYTTDNNTWVLYSGSPIMINSNSVVTVKAIASKSGWTESDPVSMTYTFTSTTVYRQPGNSESQESANRLFTAQNYEGDLSVQSNSATLWLGKGKTGKLSDIWLFYPQLFSQIPNTAKIVSAQLVLTVKGFTRNPYLAHKINLYQIPDPDGKGAPYFGESGIRNGLDYQYRDHRPGMNIPWKGTGGGGGTIGDLLTANDLVDTNEIIPTFFSAGGYTQIRLDVAKSLNSWLSGSPKQGWFLKADQSDKWAFNDGIEFYGTGDPSVTNRPKLEISFITGSINVPTEVVTSLSAAAHNAEITLSWSSGSKVLILRKVGMFPANPTDGTVVFDGVGSSKTDRGLDNGQTYYYAIFTYDNLRNYGPKYCVKATPTQGTGTKPDAPAGLTVTLTGNTLSFNWDDKSINEDWFVIEQQEDEGTWKQVASAGANQTSLVVKSDDPNFGLKPNTSYQYRIKARNAFGDSDYSPESNQLTTLQFPAAPEGLRWMIVSAGRVNLSWSDKAGNETGYRIDICCNDGNLTVIRSINLSVNANACSVTGLSPGTQYLLKVVAFNGLGESTAWSDVIITTPDPKGGLL